MTLMSDIKNTMTECVSVEFGIKAHSNCSKNNIHNSHVEWNFYIFPKIVKLKPRMLRYDFDRQPSKTRNLYKKTLLFLSYEKLKKNSKAALWRAVLKSSF